MLPKSNRLRSADFKAMRGARIFHSPHFMLRVKEAVGTGKAAAVVSLRAARTAVLRNLLRRRIYAALDPRVRGARGFFLAVTAKAGAGALSPEELKSELAALLADAFGNRGAALW